MLTHISNVSKSKIKQCLVPLTHLKGHLLLIVIGWCDRSLDDIFISCTFYSLLQVLFQLVVCNVISHLEISFRVSKWKHPNLDVNSFHNLHTMIQKISFTRIHFQNSSGYSPTSVDSHMKPVPTTATTIGFLTPICANLNSIWQLVDSAYWNIINVHTCSNFDHHGNLWISYSVSKN